MSVLPTSLSSGHNGAKSASGDASVYVALTVVLQTTLAVSLLVFALRRDWENVFLTGLVILLTLAPALAWRGYRVYIPPELQLTSAVFVFLSLFLGSAMDLYYELWWWDLVLHAASGILLGLAGFIAVFALNRRDSLPQGMRPAFVCFFGVTFAVFFGVAWEIFEFAMDSLSPGLNMQSTETGVVDTMQDLTLNTLGALAIGAGGWAYLKTGRYSYIADWMRSFMDRNPALFRPRRRRARRHALRP